MLLISEKCYITHMQTEHAAYMFGLIDLKMKLICSFKCNTFSKLHDLTTEKTLRDVFPYHHFNFL